MFTPLRKGGSLHFEAASFSEFADTNFRMITCALGECAEVLFHGFRHWQ